MMVAALLLTLAGADVRLKADATDVAARSVQLQPDEVVTDVRIQGNVVTSDAEVQRLGGIEIGMPVTDQTVDEVTNRLRATKRFDRVEVRKRYTSIADPTRIVLVVIVDEGPVRIELTGDPDHPTRVVRRRLGDLLWLPILDAQDGYGLTYGVRVAKADAAGPHSRLSFPFSWGGNRRAGVELDKVFDGGPVTRLRTGGSLSRIRNPFYNQPDERERVFLRAEHAFTPSVRLGSTVGWQHLSFQTTKEAFTQEGLDVTVDTRLDPFLARNAVYARAAWDHLDLSSGGVNRSEVGAYAYIGLIGQPILIVGATRTDSDKPLPDSLRPLLGGSANVRGFEAGTAAGDTLVAGSAELLVPLSSPLAFGRFGLSAFVDAGSVYNKGERLADERIRKGVGGGVWFSAAFVRLGVSVAHGIGDGTHVHFGVTTSF